MKRYRVKPASRLSLKDHDPDDTGDYKKNDEGKAAAKAETEKHIARVSRLQERLYGNNSRALLIVLQGMDTSGKDSTIKHVMSGVNPQGCKVVSFKAPQRTNWLRTFYGVSIERFRQRIYWHLQPIPLRRCAHYSRPWLGIQDRVVKRRYDQIREFEDMLMENGTADTEVFSPHLQEREQKKRLEERIQNPEKAMEMELWRPRGT